MYAPEQLKDLNRNAKLACFGSCLFHIILGSFYSWGNLNAYFVSYFKNRNPEAYEFLNAEFAAFIFPFMGFIMYLTTPIGIKFGSKVGFKLSSIISSVFLSVSLFVAAFCEDFWLFVIFYAFLPSIFMGLLSSESIYVVYKYKIDKISINVLMMLFYGIGTALANFIAFLTINPNNEYAIRNPNNEYYYPIEVSQHVPDYLRVISVFYIVIGILGSSFMKLPEFDFSLDEPLSLNTNEFEEKFECVYAQIQTEKDNSKKYYVGIEETVENSRFYNLKSILNSWKFYQMFLIIFLASPFGFFMVNYYKIMGLKKINDDLNFVIIGSVTGLVNGLARFLMPLVIKKIRFKVLISVLLIIQIVIIPSFFHIINNQSMFGIWNAAALFCQGGIYSIVPQATYDAFGKNLWTESYTLMLLSFVLSNILHFGISSNLLGVVGLENVLWIYFALCVVAFILAVLFKEEKNN